MYYIQYYHIMRVLNDIESDVYLVRTYINESLKA